MKHKKFDYNTLDELRADIAKAGVDLPVSDNLSVLKESVKLGDKTVPNAMGVHPMEGCDSTALGAPGELTFRRYNRFGAGGSGLLWGEACAITGEGRANPHQMWLHAETKSECKKMFDNMLGAAPERPYTVLQLTHSGRYSKPGDNVQAIVAVKKNPYLDPYTNPNRRVITDLELEKLEDKYVETALLAKKIGYDAVDIKSCHRYLISELLSARTREGKYGGSFENRTRFLLNIIDKVKANVDIDITLRLNVYDAIPAPYGWGTDENNDPDLSEPKRLFAVLRDKGIKLINISTGNPYYNPHVGRPYDAGPYISPEHQIEAAYRMLNITRELKAHTPEIMIMGTGFTWFREFGANVAAGCIERGWFDIAGFGRQAFAYPDFAKDIIENGRMIRKKCCIACSKCTEIMRYGGRTGCVIKDSEMYAPIWKEVTNSQTMMSNKPGIHI